MKIKVGVIGYGYWGPNVVRNLMGVNNAQVVKICDANEASLAKAKQAYPQIECTLNEDDIILSNDIDAVAIITPVSTHFRLSKKALENGKHIFVEKPFTASSDEAKELIDLALSKKLTIMVDHTFIFTGAVRKIKQLVDEDQLGRLYYYDSTRVSLGLFQHDVNVIWDLAPHDFSILDYLIAQEPEAITAVGVDHMNSGQENLAYITLNYPNNLIAHINVNWMSPVKVRMTMIGGEKKMLVWDDTKADEKIKIYDKGVTVDNKESIYKLMVDYRSGDMFSPHLEHEEALRREMSYFITCILDNQTPVNDGQSGLRVVKMLELTNQSLKSKGEPVAF